VRDFLGRINTEIDECESRGGKPGKRSGMMGLGEGEREERGSQHTEITKTLRHGKTGSIEAGKRKADRKKFGDYKGCDEKTLIESDRKFTALGRICGERHGSAEKVGSGGCVTF
jgi:hypothetical protein